MAYFEMHYHSDVLRLEVSVNVILPEVAKAGEGTYKTLYLLHGLSGDHTAWVRKTAIERYAADYGIAVVMPSVARSWYTDTADGAAYLTFVTEELPAVCRGFFRGMSDKREDTFVAGLSMGGYGSVKAALTHPEFYGGCASLSGALDIASRTRKITLEEWRGIFGFDLAEAGELVDSKHDIFYLARQNKAAGKPFPRLYIWCGTEDHLITANRSYHALLDELGVAHTYEESEGDHSWPWWDMHIQDALRCLLAE